MEFKAKYSVAIVEAIFGFILLVSFSGSFYGIVTCPEGLSDCGGLGEYQTITLWPIGLFSLVASLLLATTKRWQSQFLLLVALSWFIIRWEKMGARVKH